MNWNRNDNYIAGNYLKKEEFTKTSKVAGFDLDFTLIKPTGGKKFSKSSDDWEFMTGGIPDKLRSLAKDGYRVVIVSNQKGVSNGKTDLELWKEKIKNLGKELKIPFTILASFNNDLYRKPRTILWNKFIKCNRSKSFFCGDAGGLGVRMINGNKVSKDFSDSDLKFALNLGLKFIHRDEFVFGVKRECEPKYMVDFKKIPEGKYKFKPYSQELIINVGYPGSGKSFYTNNLILKHKYVYVNRDTLKTKKKCLKVCEEGLASGKSVVIDNTNPLKSDRKEFIEIANRFDIRIRCLHFMTSRELSMHNNIYRHVISDGETKMVPEIAYNIFRKKYEEPSKKEGFYKIENLDFLLDKNMINKNYFNYLE